MAAGDNNNANPLTTSFMSTLFQGFDPADPEFNSADLVTAVLSEPDTTAGDLIVLYYVCLMAPPNAGIGESADLVINALHQMVLNGNEDALLAKGALTILEDVEGVH